MKNLLPACLTFAFTLALYFILAGNPQMPAAGTPPKCCTLGGLGDKLPDLNGDSNWGRVTQTGNTFNIAGDPCWRALGTIRQDGSVLVLWTCIATMEVCPGIYSIEKDGTLVGEWGYAGDVMIEADGSLSGDTDGDEIRRTVSTVPDI